MTFFGVHSILPSQFQFEAHNHQLSRAVLTDSDTDSEPESDSGSESDSKPHSQLAG